MPEASEVGGDVRDSLTKKIGPLPLWGWGVTAVIVFVVVKKYRSGGGGTASGSTAVTTPVSSPLGYSPGADSASVDSFLQQLQGQLANIQGAAGPAKTSGGRYVPTKSLQDVLNAVHAGIPVFYQPTPGNFVQVPPDQLYAGSGYDQTYLLAPLDSIGTPSPAGGPPQVQAPITMPLPPGYSRAGGTQQLYPGGSPGGPPIGGVYPGGYRQVAAAGLRSGA